MIEPFALLEVKFGSGARAVLKREFLDKLIHVHDFGIVAGVPAEQSQEVDHSLRQIAAFTVARGYLAALGSVPSGLRSRGR